MTELQVTQICLAQETLNHVIYLTLLKVGSEMISTSTGKQTIKVALEEFMNSLSKNGFLNVPSSYFEKEVKTV